MTATTQLRQEMRINQATDNSLNQMLRQMEEMLDKTSIWETGMEVHQIQNLLDVALDTGSVEVVKNYIRYQIGRDERGSSWRQRSGKGPVFGERLITELDRLKDTAAGILATMNADEALVERVWMKLTRLYLGYLRRYFYYKKRDSGRGRS